MFVCCSNQACALRITTPALLQVQRARLELSTRAIDGDCAAQEQLRNERSAAQPLWGSNSRLPRQRAASFAARPRPLGFTPLPRPSRRGASGGSQRHAMHPAAGSAELGISAKDAPQATSTAERSVPAVQTGGKGQAYSYPQQASAPPELDLALQARPDSRTPAGACTFETPAAARLRAPGLAASGGGGGLRTCRDALTSDFPSGIPSETRWRTARPARRRAAARKPRHPGNPAKPQGQAQLQLRPLVSGGWRRAGSRAARQGGAPERSNSGQWLEHPLEEADKPAAAGAGPPARAGRWAAAGGGAGGGQADAAPNATHREGVPGPVVGRKRAAHANAAGMPHHGGAGGAELGQLSERPPWRQKCSRAAPMGALSIARQAPAGEGRRLAAAQCAAAAYEAAGACSRVLTGDDHADAHVVVLAPGLALESQCSRLEQGGGPAAAAGALLGKRQAAAAKQRSARPGSVRAAAAEATPGRTGQRPCATFDTRNGLQPDVERARVAGPRSHESQSSSGGTACDGMPRPSAAPASAELPHLSSDGSASALGETQQHASGVLMQADRLRHGATPAQAAQAAAASVPDTCFPAAPDLGSYASQLPSLGIRDCPSEEATREEVPDTPLASQPQHLGRSGGGGSNPNPIPSSAHRLLPRARRLSLHGGGGSAAAAASRILTDAAGWRRSSSCGAASDAALRGTRFGAKPDAALPDIRCNDDPDSALLGVRGDKGGGMGTAVGQRAPIIEDGMPARAHEGLGIPANADHAPGASSGPAGSPLLTAAKPSIGAPGGQRPPDAQLANASPPMGLQAGPSLEGYTAGHGSTGGSRRGSPDMERCVEAAGDAGFHGVERASSHVRVAGSRSAAGAEAVCLCFDRPVRAVVPSQCGRHELTSCILLHSSRSSCTLHFASLTCRMARCCSCSSSLKHIFQGPKLA